ncbi:MAG TPA: hypothetical protein VIY72_16075 [Acidimicrobiales bacterium]
METTVARIDTVRSSARARAAAVLMGISWATIGLGLVVGFNQLATQSPVDAVLPVALFSVGATGVVTMVAATLDPFERRGPERHLLEPPPAEEGFLHFGIGLAAIAAVGWRWGTTAQAALVGAYGLQQLLTAELGLLSLLARRRPEPDAVRIGLTGAVGVLFVAFAWSALADAGVRPFGG